MQLISLSLLMALVSIAVGCSKVEQPIETKDLVKDQKHARFELIQLGTMRRDQFLLDKETGQIWVNTCLVGAHTGPDCDYSAWLKQEVEEISMTRKDIQGIAEVYDNLRKKRK